MELLGGLSFLGHIYDKDNKVINKDNIKYKNNLKSAGMNLYNNDVYKKSVKKLHNNAKKRFTDSKRLWHF